MLDLRSRIDAGNEIVVIAEAGVNHNGSEVIAHQLIDAALEAGAQFVKFQTFDPKMLVAPNAEPTPYQRARGASSQTHLLESLALPVDAWERLRDHAADAGIGFLSTPFDTSSARLLVELGVDGLKVSSGELTNHSYLGHLSSLGVPLFVSTGMGSASEVEAAVQACAQAPYIALFHCVSAYPAPEHDCNLLAIPVLRSATGVHVGWSDHTVGTDSALAAAILGARLFEKHLTLDRNMDGPDHAASLEPDQMRDYVGRLQRVPAMLGDGRKRRMPSEQENAPLVRRSWHAVRALSAGTILTSEDVTPLRPESGVSPTENIVGRALTSDVAAYEPIRHEVLGGPTA